MDRSQGFLGDLHQKTLPQLQELLERQEKILAKRKFLESLPDKGEKVKNFAQTLRQLIAERQGTEPSLSEPGRNQSPRNQPRSPTRHVQSDFAKLRDNSSLVDDSSNPLRPILPSTLSSGGQYGTQRVNNRDGTLSVDDDEQTSVLDALTQPRGEITRNFPESVRGEGDGRGQDLAGTLSDHFQEMMVSDGAEGEVNETRDGDLSNEERRKKGGGEAMFPNTYEVVMRRSAENAGKRPPFKPNSTLKVTSVKDLPEHFKQKTQITDSQPASAGHISAEHMDQASQSDSQKSVKSPQKNVAEESAIHPPEYHFQKAKMISVEDSIELQRKQREELERIQAEHAAERLAERLHIKMDEYHTSSPDMDYRSSDRRAEEEVYDSDDDPDPDGSAY